MDPNKTEMIGKVTLNLEDYGGADLYSDGSIEDVLLDIVKNHDPQEYNRIIAEKKDWAVLYHLSQIRENIISWYPFGPRDRVLEIGSGCGAVTGAAASAAGSVTCVELSKKRSLINAYRHADLDNIEIRVGNFQDVEKKLDTDYDVITLIGVLEYAALYIDSPSPYTDFLKIIRKHLRPGGKLIAAIENRLGMKYFAGCAEDHSGRFFEGIEGYYPDSPAVTFSRPELTGIFEEAGMTGLAWYYPFPDYKLPMAVYSDGCLPKKGDLKYFVNNFDRTRYSFFDEGRALESMCADGLFPLFSNSYLVIAERDTR